MGIIKDALKIFQEATPKPTGCPSNLKCPKCGSYSGDDYRQCNGVCPLPESPHFSPTCLVSMVDKVTRRPLPRAIPKPTRPLCFFADAPGHVSQPQILGRIEARCVTWGYTPAKALPY